MTPSRSGAGADERYPAEFEPFGFDEDAEEPTGSCEDCGTDTYGDEELCDECDRLRARVAELEKPQ